MTALLLAFAAGGSSGAGWERADSVTGGSAGIRIVEFTNSSAVSIDCDWTLQQSGGDITGRIRRPSSLSSANNRPPIHQQPGLDGGLVADNSDSSSGSQPATDGIALTWLDANRQPVVSIPGIR